jgi:hypothetical protein
VSKTRCLLRGINLHQRSTRDAVEVSEGAAAIKASLLAHASHNVTCRCAAGECEPEDCDCLYISDPNGEHVATVHGRDFYARKLDSGNIAIFKAPRPSQDAVIDRVVDVMRQRLAAFNREPDPRIAALNRANEALWRRGDEK